jgi:hypothetical protein
MYFHSSYFHFQKIEPFVIFTKKMQVLDGKKTKQMYDKPKDQKNSL